MQFRDSWKNFVVNLIIVLIKLLKYTNYSKEIKHYFCFVLLLLFIVQCWTQASKPEPLKQDTQKGKDNRKENKLIFNTLK